MSNAQPSHATLRAQGLSSTAAAREQPRSSDHVRGPSPHATPAALDARKGEADWAVDSEVSEVVEKLGSVISASSENPLLKEVKDLLLRVSLGEKQKGAVREVDGTSCPAPDADASMADAAQKQRVLAYLQALLQIQLQLQRDQEEARQNHSTSAIQVQTKEDRVNSAADPSESPRTLLRRYKEDFKAMNESCQALKEERSTLKKWRDKVMEEYQELDGSLQFVLSEIEAIKAKHQADANINSILVHFIVTAVRLLVDASMHKRNVDNLLADLSRLFDAPNLSVRNPRLVVWCNRLRELAGAQTADGQKPWPEERGETQPPATVVALHLFDADKSRDPGEAETEEKAEASPKEDSPSSETAVQPWAPSTTDSAGSRGVPVLGQRAGTALSHRRRSDMPGRASQTTRLQLAPIPDRADSDGRLICNSGHGPALLGSARRRSATALGDGAFSLAAQFAVAARAPAPGVEHTPVLLPDVTGEEAKRDSPLAPADCSPAFLAAETAAAPGGLEVAENASAKESGGRTCACCGPSKRQASVEMVRGNAAQKCDAREKCLKKTGSRGKACPKQQKSVSGETWAGLAASGPAVRQRDSTASEGVMKVDRATQFDSDLQTRLEMLLESPQVRPSETKSGIEGFRGASGEGEVFRGPSSASCDLPTPFELSATASFAKELLQRANSFSLSISDVRKVLEEALGLGPDGLPGKDAPRLQPLQSRSSLYCLPPTPSPTRVGTCESTLSLLVARAGTGEKPASGAPEGRPTRAGDEASEAGRRLQEASGASIGDKDAAARVPAAPRVDRWVPCSSAGAPAWTEGFSVERSFEAKSASVSFEGGLLTPKPSRVEDAKSRGTHKADQDPQQDVVDLVAVYRAMLALEKSEAAKADANRSKDEAGTQEGGIQSDQLRQVIEVLWRQLSSPVAAVAEPKPEEKEDEGAESDASSSRAAPTLALESPVALVPVGEDETQPDRETARKSVDSVASALSEAASKTPQPLSMPAFVAAGSVGRPESAKGKFKLYTLPSLERRAIEARQAPSAFPQIVYASSIERRHSLLPGPVLTTVPCEPISSPYSLPSPAGSPAAAAPAYVLPQAVPSQVLAYPLANVPVSLLQAYYSAPPAGAVIYSPLPAGVPVAAGNPRTQRSAAPTEASAVASAPGREPERNACFALPVCFGGEKRETEETEEVPAGEALALGSEAETKRSAEKNHIPELHPHLHEHKEAERALPPLLGDSGEAPPTLRDSARVTEGGWCCQPRACGARVDAWGREGVEEKREIA
ncbi:conserved hypothetical protein [Neospora caninum Liverpool]|uniref:Uncharacterized protein n=1 Tax=Neospora caninum (strain Liverpool) TaxID=572307 RepID=F0VHP9_NEOCL|nr:conserved hypothetical protein [Neospora caninum Liverpool]CBZ53260.1 conserved hypothetical protein [Neospora caninum Liverpool]CEL67246.1 TPA: hypothetical protein BN1204_030470 [Neospora caninum Liverpool]|eukprot:XP_003883292.1 conserved hypothetical protein [Neospora caninum Liverpool]